MEATLDTVHEITKLIKKSSKREVLFKQTRSYVTPGILLFIFCAQSGGLFVQKF